MSLADPPPDPDRAALRRELLAARAAFVAGPDAAAAAAALAAHLAPLLLRLEPQCIGWYWPHRGEFDAAALARGAFDAAALGRSGGDAAALTAIAAALPFAQRTPHRMTYRQWDRTVPDAVDDCGIPASHGAEVVPDVVLVPCVGWTEAGDRLGYGAGYFDRWIDAHPGVTTVGVAWRAARLAPHRFTPGPHDRRLTLVVTEAGVTVC